MYILCIASMVIDRHDKIVMQVRIEVQLKRNSYKEDNVRMAKRLVKKVLEGPYNFVGGQRGGKCIYDSSVDKIQNLSYFILCHFCFVLTGGGGGK